MANVHEAFEGPVTSLRIIRTFLVWEIITVTANIMFHYRRQLRFVGNAKVEPEARSDARMHNNGVRKALKR